MHKRGVPLLILIESSLKLQLDTVLDLLFTGVYCGLFYLTVFVMLINFHQIAIKFKLTCSLVYKTLRFISHQVCI